MEIWKKDVEGNWTDPLATAPATRRLWIAALCLAALFVNPGTALAQDDNRGGFTLLINAGYAVQHDSASGKSGDGQAGLNLGIGGFLTRNLALMFRVSERPSGPKRAYWGSSIRHQVC